MDSNLNTHSTCRLKKPNKYPTCRLSVTVTGKFPPKQIPPKKIPPKLNKKFPPCLKFPPSESSPLGKFPHFGKKIVKMFKIRRRIK